MGWERAKTYGAENLERLAGQLEAELHCAGGQDAEGEGEAWWCVVLAERYDIRKGKKGRRAYPTSPC